MNENLKFSEQLLSDSLNRLQKELEPNDPASPELDILYDEDVMKLLKVSRTTLYHYRKEKRISYFKLGGRNIYFRHQLYRDLMRISQAQALGAEKKPKTRENKGISKGS